MSTTPENEQPFINDAARKVIIEVLCGQALADHLGDVRDAETKLWKLIGVELRIDDYDDESAFRTCRNALRRYDYPLPDYLQGDND